VVQIKKLHSALVGDSHVQLGAVKPPEVHDDGDAAAAALDCWLRAVATWYTMPVLRTETRVVPGALPAGPPLTVTDGVVRLRFAIGGDRSQHAELAVTGVRFMNEPAASAPDASAPWYTQGYASLYKWWKSSCSSKRYVTVCVLAVLTAAARCVCHTRRRLLAFS
jgi:hypothetical protein